MSQVVTELVMAQFLYETKSIVMDLKIRSLAKTVVLGLTIIYRYDLVFYQE